MLLQKTKCYVYLFLLFSMVVVLLVCRYRCKCFAIICRYKTVNEICVKDQQQNKAKLSDTYGSLIRELQQRLEPLSKSAKQAYLLSNGSRYDFSQKMQSTVLIRDVFHYMKNGTFVEAGAVDGEYDSNTLMLERNFSWTGLLVEPDPVSYERMTRKGRKSWLLNSCIGIKEIGKQEAIFRIFEKSKWLNRMLGTGLIPAEPDDDDEAYTDVSIACYPLAAMLVASNLWKIDLLILDIDGVEQMAIRHFPWKCFKINVVMLECFGCVGKDGVLISKDEEVIKKRILFKSVMEEQGFYETHYIPYFDIIYQHKNFKIN